MGAEDKIQVAFVFRCVKFKQIETPREVQEMWGSVMLKPFWSMMRQQL